MVNDRFIRGLNIHAPVLNHENHEYLPPPPECFPPCGSFIKVCNFTPPIDFPPGGRDEPAVPSHGSKPVRFEEVDPQATRSLFVGNIPKNISVYDVRDSFQRYGTILVSTACTERFH